MTTPTPDQPDAHGYTIGIFLPSEASEEQIELVSSRIAALLFGELLKDRGNWDPAMVGQRGDVFQIEKDCECCEPHVYLSTSCFHNNHDYCKSETGLLGNKVPASCKFCLAPCTCVCHRQMHNGERDESNTV